MRAINRASSVKCGRGAFERHIGAAFSDPGSKNDAAAGEAIARLVEMLPGFRAHRSIPSSRISLISDVRQR